MGHSGSDFATAKSMLCCISDIFVTRSEDMVLFQKHALEVAKIHKLNNQVRHIHCANIHGVTKYRMLYAATTEPGKYRYLLGSYFIGKICA